MEIPVAVVLGAAGTLASAVIAAFVSMHSNRTTQEMALLRLQHERDRSNTDTGFSTMRGGIDTLQGVVDRISAERDRLYADVDKKQARIDALEEKIRTLEDEADEWFARCARVGEPCRGRVLNLVQQTPPPPKELPPPPPENDTENG